MTWALRDNLFFSNVPYTDSLITTSGSNQRAIIVEGEGCDQIIVLQSEKHFTGFNIPNLDSIICRCRSQNILSCRMKRNKTNLLLVTLKDFVGCNIFYFFRVFNLQRVIFWYSPQSNIAIIRAGSYNIVVKRIPISIKNRSLMATKKGNLIRKLSILCNWNNTKRTASYRIPIDRDIFGISIDKIRIPSVVSE